MAGLEPAGAESSPEPVYAAEQGYATCDLSGASPC